jgi:nicotinate phosphoribosyltransferase
VRLDSGDLLVQARQVRAQLDALGAHNTRIIVTSDLDEHSIAALAAAPVDAYGVGTALVTGSGAPTAGLVYKLVAREDDAGHLVDVAKTSKDKTSVGGRKWALRRLDARGVAEAEVIGFGTMPGKDDKDGTDGSDVSPLTRPLMVELMRHGEIVVDLSLDVARRRHEQSRAELPPRALQLSRGGPAITTVFQDGHR